MDSSSKSSEEKAALPMPEYQRKDLERPRNRLIVAIAIYSVLILVFIGILIAGILLKDKTETIVCAIVLVPLSLYLVYMVYILTAYSRVLKLLYAHKVKPLVPAWEKTAKTGKGKSKMMACLNLVIYYFDQDDLEKAQFYLDQITFPQIREGAAPLEISLDLQAGKLQEAYRLYVNYAAHHRDVGSMTGRHQVVALDGFFHKLEGKPLSSAEEQDMKDLQTSPLAQRLLASFPWPAEKWSAILTPQDESQRQINLEKAVKVQDAKELEKHQKLSPWLLASFIVAIVSLVVFFFLAVLLVPSNDPTIPNLHDMWVMAFAAGFGLLCLVLGLIAKHKEPQDHFLKNIIAGFIVFLIGTMASFTAIEPSNLSHDYAAIQATVATTGITLPAEAKCLTTSYSSVPTSTAPFSQETIINFTSNDTYRSFLTSFVNRGDTLSDLSDYAAIAGAGSIHYSSKDYPFDYSLLYNVDLKITNRIPGAGEYHYIQVSHCEETTWFWVGEYTAFVA